jgi:hypothetical protein
MSKQVIAGLAGLVVLVANKTLTWCGLPHLAPSIVTAIVIAIGGLATYLAEVAPQKKTKHWHALISVLALASAIGAQYAPLNNKSPAPIPATSAVEITASDFAPDAVSPADVEVIEIRSTSEVAE